MSFSQQELAQVGDHEARLLNHFKDKVLPSIFPFAEVNQPGYVSDVVLPALESSRCFRNCCLSTSAIDLHARGEAQGDEIEEAKDLRYAAISELCEMLGSENKDHLQILAVTLGMIIFNGSVERGQLDDRFPDLPWHSHLQGAFDSINELELPQAMTRIETINARPPFYMTLAFWIDILGATILGRRALFASIYRAKLNNESTSGLCELMGCNDRIMYLISEIGCIEELKREGTYDIDAPVRMLAEQIDMTKAGRGALALPYTAAGAICPLQLSRNVTAIFRLAARIYLCSLVRHFDYQATATIQLVTRFAEIMDYIPPGPNGLDRILVWPYLVAGGASTPTSPFRPKFEERVAALGEQAFFGFFGCMVRLLREVWKRDVYVPWQAVMLENKWNFLLI